MKKPALQLVLLYVLLAWSLACQLTLSGVLLYSQSQATKHVQPPFFLERYSTTIARVPPAYREHGLQRDDQVLALDGVAVDGDRTSGQGVDDSTPW